MTPRHTPTRTNDPSVIEHRLLELAYTTDLAITAPSLAYYAPCSIEDAERVLDRLVAESRLRLDVDDEGNVTYTMPKRERIPQHASPSALAPRPPAPLAPRSTNAAVAAVLSLIVPGGGQLYLGRPISAVTWFALVTLGYMMLVIPGLLLHALCVASAASIAHQPRPITA